MVRSSKYSLALSTIGADEEPSMSMFSAGIVRISSGVMSLRRASPSVQDLSESEEIVEPTLNYREEIEP